MSYLSIHQAEAAHFLGIFLTLISKSVFDSLFELFYENLGLIPYLWATKTKLTANMILNLSLGAIWNN